jgi:hypothetical protein
MDREKVILTPEKLRAAMQAHFRAFVSDVRAVVDPKTGVVALEVHFAQQPLSFEQTKTARH